MLQLADKCCVQVAHISTYQLTATSSLIKYLVVFMIVVHTYFYIEEISWPCQQINQNSSKVQTAA